MFTNFNDGQAVTVSVSVTSQDGTPFEGFVRATLNVRTSGNVAGYVAQTFEQKADFYEGTARLKLMPNALLAGDTYYVIELVRQQKAGTGRFETVVLQGQARVPQTDCLLLDILTPYTPQTYRPFVEVGVAPQTNGVWRHKALLGRDEADQHDVRAITGLAERLATLEWQVLGLPQPGSEAEAAAIRQHNSWALRSSGLASQDATPSAPDEDAASPALVCLVHSLLSNLTTLQMDVQALQARVAALEAQAQPSAPSNPVAGPQA